MYVQNKFIATNVLTANKTYTKNGQYRKVTVNNLKKNLPVKTGPQKQLVSGKITENDLSFVPIQSVTGTADQIDATTTSGSCTLSLLQSGVEAKSYTNPTISIDSFGRITNAINGSGASVSLVSAGGASNLVVDGVGPDLSICGLSGSANGLSVSAPAAGVVTIGNTLTGASLGGTAAVFADKTGAVLNLRGITAGTGIAVTQNANDIVIDNADGGSSVSLASAGGETLVNDGIGPALATKGLTAGTGGISLTGAATAVTIENTLTGSNLGGGAAVLFSAKTGSTLQFNTLGGGRGLTVSAPASNLISLALTGQVPYTLWSTVGAVSANNTDAETTLTTVGTPLSSLTSLVDVVGTNREVYLAGTISAAAGSTLTIRWRTSTSSAVFSQPVTFTTALANAPFEALLKYTVHTGGVYRAKWSIRYGSAATTLMTRFTTGLTLATATWLVSAQWTTANAGSTFLCENLEVKSVCLG